MRLWGLGERSRGSGRSPAAKRVLAHFRHKFEAVWMPENETFAIYGRGEKDVFFLNLKLAIPERSNFGFVNVFWVLKIVRS